ncbi:hypothetical protein [Daejeonella sp.]|uniref:hypothetical protein n=1 Tax=Daejeonella sp. TaxID=2805397 RepID=UPI0039832729
MRVITPAIIITIPVTSRIKERSLTLFGMTDVGGEKMRNLLPLTLSASSSRSIARDLINPSVPQKRDSSPLPTGRQVGGEQETYPPQQNAPQGFICWCEGPAPQHQLNVGSASKALALNLRSQSFRIACLPVGRADAVC